MTDAEIIRIMAKWMVAEAERGLRKTERRHAYLLARRLGNIWVHMNPETPYDNGGWAWNLSHNEMSDEQRAMKKLYNDSNDAYRRAAAVAGANRGALRRLLEKRHNLTVTPNPEIVRLWSILAERERVEQDRQMREALGVPPDGDLEAALKEALSPL